MIRPDWRVFIVGCNLIHLHELMELGFGIFNGPVAVNARIHIQWFGLFHALLLLRSINKTVARSVVVVIIIRTICLAHSFGTFALLKISSRVQRACHKFISMKILTWKTGADAASAIRAGSAPPPSRASAGTSLAANCPDRTRKLTKSRAAFFSASFFAVEFPAPTYERPGIRTSHRNLVRCFGPELIQIKEMSTLTIHGNTINLPVGRLSYEASLRDLVHHSFKNDLISDIFTKLILFADSFYHKILYVLNCEDCEKISPLFVQWRPIEMLIESKQSTRNRVLTVGIFRQRWLSGYLMKL